MLTTDAPIGTGVQVSHETIYKSLFVRSRGVLTKELQKHLRSGRPTRRNIHNTVTGQWRSQIKDAVSIRERPVEVEDRAIPGHREGDLLLGRHWTQVATVVERATRFTVLVALDGRDMTTVSAGLTREMTRLPEQVCVGDWAERPASALLASGRSRALVRCGAAPVVSRPPRGRRARRRTAFQAEPGGGAGQPLGTADARREV